MINKAKIDGDGFIAFIFNPDFTKPVGLVVDAPELGPPDGCVWRLVDGAFVEFVDRRGQTFYGSDDTQKVTISTLLQEVPEGWTRDKPVGADLRAARAEKWEQVKRQRDAAEAGGFPYMGKVIDSNPISVQRITGSVQAAQDAVEVGEPFSITWTCADNSLLNLDAAGMKGMPAALARHANTQHEKARVLRAAIAAATTPEEVATIAW